MSGVKDGRIANLDADVAGPRVEVRLALHVDGLEVRAIPD